MVDVGPVVRLAFQLFGGHVVQLALEQADLGHVALVRPLGDAEVDHLGHTVATEHDVAQAHIPMHDAHRLALVVGQPMRMGQATTDTREDVGDVAEGTAAITAHHLGHTGEVGPVDVLHDHVRDAVVVSDFEDLGHVAVVEASAEACLVQEHLLIAFFAHMVGMQDLDHNALAEPADAFEPAAIGQRHPAGTDALVDDIAADASGELGVRETGQHQGSDARACGGRCEGPGATSGGPSSSLTGRRAAPHFQNSFTVAMAQFQVKAEDLHAGCRCIPLQPWVVKMACATASSSDQDLARSPWNTGPFPSDSGAPDRTDIR